MVLLAQPIRNILRLVNQLSAEMDVNRALKVVSIWIFPMLVIQPRDWRIYVVFSSFPRQSPSE